MSSHLYTYSMVNALFAMGKDYIDSFWPFILKILPENKSALTFESIQSLVRVQFGLNIPVHSLSIILNRAKRKGFVLSSNKYCSLTTAGLEFRSSLEIEKDVKRRTNELITDAGDYLRREHNLSFSLDETKDILQRFVLNNIELFEEFINPEFKSDNIVLGKECPNVDRAVLKYFQHIEKVSATQFETLKDIIRGSIISVIIHDRSIGESSRKFEKVQLYFDANILFSILGFHHEEYVKPAKELFSLIRTCKTFDTLVFDFTRDEMVSVLKGYINEESEYFSDIKVASIYSSMKLNGVSRSDIIEYIANIENKLWELGFRIKPTSINLRKYDPPNPEARKLLLNYKPDQGMRGQNHDLAAIEMVKKIRGNSVRILESSVALFLTSDLGLARYNYSECDHKEKSTVSEVITDRLLTNILWLKNPTLLRSISIDSLIAAHSRELLIDKEVWRKFLKKVKELRRDGKLSDHEISVLIYDPHTRETLAEYDLEHAKDVENTKWILNNVEEAKKRIEEKNRHDRELYADKVVKGVEEAKKNKEDQIFQTIADMKSEIESETNNSTRRVIIVCITVIVVLYAIGILYYYSLIRKYYETISLWFIIATCGLWLIILLLGAVGLKKESVQEKIRLVVFNYIYKIKMRSSKLEAVERALR